MREKVNERERERQTDEKEIILFTFYPSTVLKKRSIRPAIVERKS